jgi:hypothetical protein
MPSAGAAGKQYNFLKIGHSARGLRRASERALASRTRNPNRRSAKRLAKQRKALKAAIQALEKYQRLISPEKRDPRSTRRSPRRPSTD